MFCHKCGTQLNDDTKFCHVCGTRVAPAESTDSVPEKKETSYQPQSSSEYSSSSSRSNSSKIWVVLICIAAASAIIYFVKNANTADTSATASADNYNSSYSSNDSSDVSYGDSSDDSSYNYSDSNDTSYDYSNSSGEDPVYTSPSGFRYSAAGGEFYDRENGWYLNYPILLDVVDTYSDPENLYVKFMEDDVAEYTVTIEKNYWGHGVDMDNYIFELHQSKQAEFESKAAPGTYTEYPYGLDYSNDEPYRLNEINYVGKESGRNWTVEYAIGYNDSDCCVYTVTAVYESSWSPGYNDYKSLYSNFWSN